MDRQVRSILGMSLIICVSFAYAFCIAYRLRRQSPELSPSRIVLWIAIGFIFIYLIVGVVFFLVLSFRERHLPLWAVFGLLLDVSFQPTVGGDANQIQSFFILSEPPLSTMGMNLRWTSAGGMLVIECVCLTLTFRFDKWPQLGVILLHLLWTAAWRNFDYPRLILSTVWILSIVPLFLSYTIIFSMVRPFFKWQFGSLPCRLPLDSCRSYFFVAIFETSADLS